ncbi:MAG TPA: SDR family NAD(P)-dependent oxidoreductase [Streptosporangiaceae bacterium]|nr:SDR family NAD(P)-dependent oxidoreductase [Streptosporangiaceae bacterium]
MSQEKVAIIAGAGGALGHATTAVLAARGFSVVALDRNEHALSDLSDAVRKEVADPADPGALTGVIDRIAAEVGPPGVLVNAVGAFRVADALDTTPEMLRLMLDVNLGPALWLSQAVAPHMRQRGSGAIVHVTARLALEPASGMAAYSVSKAALAHLTRTLDLELRPFGIRVNAVAPQLIDTASNRASLPAEVIAHAVAPEAIAEVIAFLVSDAAAPVSGAILPAYGA